MLFINKYIYLFSEEKSLATQTFLWRRWTWEGGGGSGEDGRAGIRERSRKLELERRWRRCKGGQWLSSCTQADGVEREEKEQLRSELDGWLWKTEYFSQLCPLLYLHCRLKNEKVKTRSNALAKIWKENLRDAFPFQNGWIFGKVPKGGGGHFQSKNLYCKIWTFKQGYLTMKLIQV